FSRRREHRQVGLAASAWKRGSDVGGVTLGVLEAQYKHVLRKPAFLATLPTRDSQRHAFLAQQGVAAVAGADRPDGVVLRKMADEPAVGIDVERAVNAAAEVVAVAEHLERARAHPRHDF